jgi:hypothetical protein
MEAGEVIGSGMRYLGVDDAPFGRKRGSSVLVVGAVCRGVALDGVLSTKVRRDGWNATDKLSEMIVTSKFRAQLHAILLDGVAVGGLNVVDLELLHERTRLPVLTVIRRKPDMRAVARACSRLPRPEKRMEIIRRAGPVHRGESAWFQSVGLSFDVARSLLSFLTVSGNIPEPVRLAHLIAGGVVTGESGRRA